jgi:hypothetical protein
MCSRFKIAAGYVSLSKPRGFDAPLMFAVRFSNINRVCAPQGRSHKRSEVVVVTPYGCTRVCSSSVNADLRASYQAKAPNATDTTAAMANNIHIAGFLPRGTPSLVQNGNAVKDPIRRRSRRSGQVFEPEQLRYR